jgi:hypothetical protein
MHFDILFSLFLGLSSSSSRSSLTNENDDSQSRDSVSVPNDDLLALSDAKTSNNKIPIDDQPILDEEEGEIKDEEDDDEDDNEDNSNLVEAEPLPVPQPISPPIKKSTTKKIPKQNKKPGPPKKRKIESIKSEPIQEQDDIDSSSLAKRKKR